MASITLVNSSSRLALSSDAHMPHYIGEATYIGYGPVQVYQSMMGLTQNAYIYQINSAFAPLAFVRLSSSVGYAVRLVSLYSTGVWRISVATDGAIATPPRVFCFGRLQSTKPGGPAMRLFDSAGAVAFDSQSAPMRVVGRPEFPAYNANSDPGSQLIALPSGMIQPAVCMDCIGYQNIWVKSGAYWNVNLYAYQWYLSGASLKRGKSGVGLDGREDGGGPTSGVRTDLPYQKPAVIESYGL